jgi:hypothetical protein
VNAEWGRQRPFSYRRFRKGGYEARENTLSGKTMRRILLILLIFVLLLQQRHSPKDDPVAAGALLVTATPLPLDGSDPGRTRLGPLRWLGSWDLRSRQDGFGSISSMIVAEDGALLALSDGATLMGFRVGGPRGTTAATGGQFIAPLPIRPHERSWPNWKWDSESMVHAPVSGAYWVGFELQNRICRYSPGFARVEECRKPPEMQDWPDTGGAEAMTRLPDGRFLVFSEKGAGPGPAIGNDLLVFSGDPAEDATPPALRITYRPPQGFVPTDAVYIGHNRLIVLNRRVTFYEGFTAMLALVDMPPLRPGAVLVGKPIAHLAPPVLADNFEALAIGREGKDMVLWVASDDNNEFFQRTLLLKFALPRDWWQEPPRH